MNIYEINEKLYQGIDLNEEETTYAFNEILTGNLDPILVSSFTTALKIKDPIAVEIMGAAKALLKVAKPFPYADYDVFDIVGTGGDGLKTINISSMSAIVCAELGIKVAKHGNRSVSSKTGSSDLLRELGINIEVTPEKSRSMLDQINICFLFAPLYHSALRFVAPIRKVLATRTIYNILGPLINPAHANCGLIGVYSKDLLDKYADTLLKLGQKRTMVVYGNGLDEITITGDTNVCEIKNGIIEKYTLTPQSFGFKTYEIKDIQGGEPAENKQITLDILNGKGKDAHNAAVASNVAAVLYIAGKVDSLKDGAEMALSCLKEGKAINTLNNFIKISNE